MAWFSIRRTLSAVMAGEHEAATGLAKITLERVNGRVCFKLAWSGIGSPVAAHIHEDGAAVLPLFVDVPKRQGCVKAHQSLIRKMAECPNRYHVKLHTHSEPDGALYGQL